MLFDVVDERIGSVESSLTSHAFQMLSLNAKCNSLQDVHVKHEPDNGNLGTKDLRDSFFFLQYVADPVMERGLDALKAWTGKIGMSILYDSAVDGMSVRSMFKKVSDKQDIALIATTTDGDVFGGFYNVAVTRKEKRFKDPDMFIFSFESHGRCTTPQRFPVKEKFKENDDALVYFYKNDDIGFVRFGVDNVGGFRLGDERSMSFCKNVSCAFEGLEDTTLTGKTGLNTEDEHHCSRLVALQLE